MSDGVMVEQSCLGCKFGYGGDRSTHQCSFDCIPLWCDDGCVERKISMDRPYINCPAWQKGGE